MRIRFPRLADGRRSYSVVERSDGVRFRVRQGVAGPAIPHDLVHLVVDRELGEDGGFWGAVAAGAVFASMDHLDGRRPPHSERRSIEVIRGRSGRLHRAEMVAELVQLCARRRMTTPDQVRRAAREVLATLPDSAVDERRVAAAAEALRETELRWAALPVGEELVVDWPEGHSRRRR
ncbi:hypothetical protein GCM10023322_56540 [Rugosimonospora acidiphila]|uniref:Uncharacterized protein n=1 Tax=Rugosimonospora acidiphila TaxID=556531 RepID=A0ABP9SEG2_9ACTN